MTELSEADLRVLIEAVVYFLVVCGAFKLLRKAFF